MTAPNRDHWSTPREFIAVVRDLYGPIGVDVCANHENAVAPKFYSEVEPSLMAWHNSRGESHLCIGVDGLAQDWIAVNGLHWCNPPGSTVKLWVGKALLYARERGVSTLLLVVESYAHWSRELQRGSDVVRLTPRIAFNPPLGVKDEKRPDMDRQLVLVTPATAQAPGHRLSWFDWREHYNGLAQRYGWEAIGGRRSRTRGVA